MSNNNNFIKQYNNEIYAKTKKYQKIYGFEIGTGEHDTWNNEADAFKHTFMQADLVIKLGVTGSKLAGDWHELDGRLNNQPKSEENMDKWNNAVGREIGEEIKQEIKNKNYSNEEIDDLIAKKVMERMRAGKLITHPSDKRKYTGFAANIGDDIDLPQGKIFTAEEIGKLSTDDFQKFENYIHKQLKEFGVPREYQARNMAARDDLILVDDYKRQDETHVNGYYRRK